MTLVVSRCFPKRTSSVCSRGFSSSATNRIESYGSFSSVVA